MAIGNMWVTTYKAGGAFTLWLVLADGYGALRCIDTADTEEGAYAIIQAIEDGARAVNPHFDKKRKQAGMKKKTKIGRAA